MKFYIVVKNDATGELVKNPDGGWIWPERILRAALFADDSLRSKQIREISLPVGFMNILDK